MLTESLPADGKDHLKAEKILQAGKRGKELTSQIMHFSRNRELERVSLSIRDLLQEIIKLNRAVLPANIEIEEQIRKGCFTVSAAPTHIHQIGMNLITNATHAIEPERGKITVSLENTIIGEGLSSELELVKGPYVHLRVADTGTGIDPEILDKVFEPYFTTKEIGKGSGMGLSIIYGIVHDLKGAIKIRSRKGIGTEVSVYLPADQKAESSVSPGNLEYVPRGHESILMVDDEEMITSYESELLGNLGYHVTSVNNSREALNIFRQDPGRFDLVLSDMNMPEMNGMEFSNEIRKIRPGIPVILCTGFNENIGYAGLSNPAIAGILKKPLTGTELGGKIRSVLDLPS